MCTWAGWRPICEGRASRRHAAATRLNPELTAVTERERLVLLTRDRYLLMRSNLDRGYWVRSTAPKQQFVEILKRFQLSDTLRLFTRCMVCNGQLTAGGAGCCA